MQDRCETSTFTDPNACLLSWPTAVRGHVLKASTMDIGALSVTPTCQTDPGDLYMPSL